MIILARLKIDELKEIELNFVIFVNKIDNYCNIAYLRVGSIYFPRQKSDPPPPFFFRVVRFGKTLKRPKKYHIVSLHKIPRNKYYLFYATKKTLQCEVWSRSHCDAVLLILRSGKISWELLPLRSSVNTGWG